MRTLTGLLLLATATAVVAQPCSTNHNGKDIASTVSDNCVAAESSFADADTRQLAGESYSNRDYAAAHKVYLTLAKNGDKFSQYRLAVMYQKGRGIEQNLPQAYAWSEVASETGQQDYLNYHRRLSRQLNDAQIVPAGKLAEEYLAKYGIASKQTVASTKP